MVLVFKKKPEANLFANEGDKLHWDPRLWVAAEAGRPKATVVMAVQGEIKRAMDDKAKDKKRSSKGRSESKAGRTRLKLKDSRRSKRRRGPERKKAFEKLFRGQADPG